MPRKRRTTIAIAATLTIVVIAAIIAIVIVNDINQEPAPIIPENTETAEDLAYIKMDTTALSPYTWRLNIVDPTVVQIIGQDSETMDETQEDSPVVETYIFQGLKEGETAIDFSLVNENEEAIKSREFIIQVDRNNHVKVTENTNEQ